MVASSTGDETAWSRPADSARQRRPASTVMKTSAGLFAPSLVIRAISSSESPSITLTSMPVSSSKRS